jgi:alkylhydroperoxidase family enzyme
MKDTFCLRYKIPSPGKKMVPVRKSLRTVVVALVGGMFVASASSRPIIAQSPPRRVTEVAAEQKPTSAEKPSPATGKDSAAQLPDGRDSPACRVPLLDDEAAWEKLPAVQQTSGKRLPHWARALAGTLPRTTAAMLELDFLYRTSDAFDSKLRAKMRWVAARANRCGYSEVYARADLMKAGGTPPEMERLAAGVKDSVPAERAALTFARKMTLAASTVTDDEVRALIEEFGEGGVVAMVEQLAYANFQDRLVTTLGLTVEAGGPLAPLEVHFAPPPADQKPQPAERPPLPETSPVDAPTKIADPEWTALTFAELQGRMEAQRARKSRVSIPRWEDFRAELDPQLFPPDRPTRIQWSLVVVGHQPRLGAAWINCLRTFGREANQDRIFEETLFWVITRSLECFY